MKRLMLSLLVLGLAVIAPVLAPHSGNAAVAQSNGTRFMVVDIAFDGRTFAINPVNPAATDITRGDTFVLNGKLYQGGAIPGGDTFSPDAPNSIGNFICRGTMLYNGSEIAAGAAPFVATTQTFLFDNGDALFTEGLEAGVSEIDRLVTGGLGQFSGMSGEVHLELLGFNNTDFENYRATFKLKKNK